MKTMNKKAIVKKLLSMGLILVFFMLAIIINLASEYLSDRYGLSYDLSANKIYELSDETVDVLSSLSDKINFFVLMKEIDFSTKNLFAQTNEILHRYRIASNGMIDIQYIDIYTNPDFINKYVGEALSEGAIIIESGSRHQVLSIEEMFQVNQDPVSGEYYIHNIIAEQKITTSIISTTGTSFPKVALITGHNEQYSNTMAQMIEDAGYLVETLNITRESIDNEIGLLVISAPNTDYSEHEIDKLEAFQDSGGDMIVLFSPYMPELPVLERYFESWNIRFDRAVVIDNINSLSGYPMQIFAFNEMDEIADKLKKRLNAPLLMPGCRPIRFEGNAAAGSSTAVALISSNEAYIKPLEALSDELELRYTQGDELGQFNLAAVSQRFISDEIGFSRIFFYGTHLMASDSLINQPSWLNRAYLIESLYYANGQESAVAVTPRNFVSGQLIITNAQANIVLFLIVILYPSLIIATSILVWNRRRKL